MVPVLIVDLIIAVLILAVAVWGYRQGGDDRSAGAGRLRGWRAAGVSAGAVVLDGVLRDPYAPVLAVPAALLAAALERVGFSCVGACGGAAG